MKVDVTVIINHLRVLINDTLHLSLDIGELVGIQAWMYGNYQYVIEYTMKTTAIKTEYDNIETWKDILGGLAKIQII